ncbi:uncharacterized protein B0H64DRAFT_477092 [Chaetomium fimeti]|uniref:Tetraspanin-like protein n=1 Tax=Chaetomium fimeti TaxID=1854472 RepID=A0AAE0HC65_9PEZI|nr:hypothetical protein B0H64DRAFT_477092 [Chaetomium fimeti]
MALLLILYGLIILALVGTAIYEHVTISTLSLPVPPALTILTILLPLLSPLTTLLAPRLFNQPRHTRKRLAIPQDDNHHNNNNHPQPPNNRTRKGTTTLLPPLTHLAQLLLTTILTTLYTSTLATPTTTDCLLTHRWTTFWKSHDAPAIRAIQDALSCCGFRSTKDMAWPFPHGSGKGAGAGACEAQFGRHEPCLPGWEGALRRAVGGELGVVLAVGALQVLGVVLARRGGFGVRMGGGGGGGEGMGWMAGLERLIAGGGGGGREGGVEAGSRRPLLAGPEQEGEATGNGGRVVESAYRDISDEETEGGDGEGEGGARPRIEERGHGASSEGPRVEPAHHDPWAGVQRA